MPDEMNIDHNLLPLAVALLTVFAPACTPASADPMSGFGPELSDESGDDDDDDDDDDDEDDEDDDDDDDQRPDGSMEGGDPPDMPVPLLLCERMDGCNFLPSGFDVNDCSDVLGSCADDLLSSARADWETGVVECLELENYQNFAGCVAAYDVCEVEPDPEPEPEPEPAEDTDTACSDGVDNDGDGWFDCDDYDCDGTAVCGAGQGSCAGYCGDQSPAGCWCDDICSESGDCCSDFEAVC